MNYFAVMVSKEFNLPHVVNKNSIAYLDYCAAGYIEHFTGSKKECTAVADEMLEEIYTNY